MSWRLAASAIIVLALSAQSFAGSGQHRHGKRHFAASTSAIHLGWNHVHSSPLVYFVPGYTVAPGRGFGDDACDLPSSPCPNWQRANY